MHALSHFKSRRELGRGLLREGLGRSADDGAVSLPQSILSSR